MVGINCLEDPKFTAEDWVGARDMRDIRDLAMITDAMLRRGYSEARIQKFLGGNLLRVLRTRSVRPKSLQRRWKIGTGGGTQKILKARLSSKRGPRQERP
jgi:hypothetical protein